MKSPRIILVIEDDPQELAFAVELVRQAGHFPLGVSDYAEAVGCLPDKRDLEQGDVPLGLFTMLKSRYSREELATFRIGLTKFERHEGRDPAKLSAILTDLMIPNPTRSSEYIHQKGGIEDLSPRPWGLTLLSKAVLSGIPSALVTDLEAHGRDDGDWIFPVVRDLGRGKDLAYICIRRGENGRKRWDQALDWLSKYKFQEES